MNLAFVLSLIPVASILGGFVWYWRRPILDLTVEPAEPWGVQTRVDIAGRASVDTVMDGVVNYYRARVENRGRTQARGCHVTLAAIWYTERTVWKRLTGWEPVDLVWSGRPGDRVIGLSRLHR